MIVGGRVVPIPPHSPLFAVLEQISVLHSAEAIRGIEVLKSMRTATIREIGRLVATAEESINDIVASRTFEGMNRRPES